MLIKTTVIVFFLIYQISTVLGRSALLGQCLAVGLLTLSTYYATNRIYLSV